MTRFEDLVEHLVEAFAAPSERPAVGERIVTTDLNLDLPVETLIDDDGLLLATLPRGQLATGFELPVGRLRVRCREVES